MYELVVVWEDGEKTIYECDTREQAERGQQNMKMSFGNQVAWSGVREKRGDRA